jgi:putative ABC transport system permease protein
MLRSYLTVALRNLLKNKAFSIINIFGLGIGLAACLLIFQFVSYELSYDKFNEKLSRTYRVTNDRFQNGKLIQHGTIMYPTIGPTMAKDFAEIEEYTRIMPGGEMNIKAEDRIFRGDDCLFVDNNFLSVFSFPLLAGERSSALKERYSLVITEAVANKYFSIHDRNYESAVGRVVYWGLDPQPYKITGICKAPPENSHIQFDVLVSYSTLYDAKNHDADDSWTWSDMRHYLVLRRDANYKTLEQKFPAYSERYFKGDKVSGSVEKFYLQPMKDAHLYSDYEYDIARTANGKAVWAMLIVAFFILVIAWINYINLTTSRSMERAKEVGLRKVMGAIKSQLIKQFILESIFISLLAVVVALLLVYFLQSPFNNIISSQLSFSKMVEAIDMTTLTILGAIMIVGILLSGFYPAFVLSSYQPVTVLKGKFQSSFKGQVFRKGLVIFQFMASTALIVCTMVVSMQLKFMNETDLGIKLENTLIVLGPERTAWDSTFIQRIETYKEELKKVEGVVSVATSSRLPGDRLGRSFGIRLSDGPSETHYTLSNLGVDYNFFDTYGVSLIAGRKFLPTDHKVKFQDLNTVILNENAVKLLGIKSAQDAIGKEIIWGRLNDKDRLWTVIGVVGNFHQEALKNPMEAMVFRPTYSTYSPASIKIKGGDHQKIVAGVEQVFKKAFPDNAFEYSFLEDKYNRQYADDNRFGKVISIFTILAIIISCLGLIGLSSYAAIQRTKEIGIRKVLGASLLNIVTLLSSNFIGLVVLAALMSIPLSYIAMQNWLEGYAYKINLGWLVFVIPVIFILLIAALTMSFQVVTTAMTNPAKTLKYE